MKKSKEQEEAATEIREILGRNPELMERLDPLKRIVCEAILQTPLRKDKGDTSAHREAAATAAASK